jgi:hypothetical protein
MSKNSAKIVQKTLDDDSLTSLFQQLLGTDKPAPDVIVPKYVKITSNIKLITRLLRSFTNDVFLVNYPELTEQAADIISYCDSLESLDIDLDLKTTTTTEVVDAYMIIKNNKDVGELLNTCKILIENKTNLTSVSIDTGFVNRLPGVTYFPLSFTKMNLKELWSLRQTTEKIKNYIIMVLKVLYKKTHAVYTVLTSPDIDVSKFSALIIDSIAKVKKQIPRCDAAFDRIEKSVDLLNGNFDGYYKDFVQSQDPTVIMQGFVMDVANQDGVDAKTTFQFRKIISFYQKKTQGKIKDPRVKQIFELLGQNMSILEGNESASDIKKYEEEEKKAQATDDARVHEEELKSNHNQDIEPAEPTETVEPTEPTETSEPGQNIA